MKTAVRDSEPPSVFGRRSRLSVEFSFEHLDAVASDNGTCLESDLPRGVGVDPVGHRDAVGGLVHEAVDGLDELLKLAGLV